MGKKKAASRRDSNMELLRIAGIFMIIVFHCSYKSGFGFAPGVSVNKLIVKTFWMLGELGVNLFMLISGYYMVRGRFKWKKLVRLLAEVQVWHWATIWVGTRLGVYTLTGWKSVLFALFPVAMNWYWFITAYILIYILSPFFNVLIHAMDRKTYRRFLASVLGLWCVIPTLMGLFQNTTESMLYYNRMIWLAIMYFLGAYIYIYMRNDKKYEQKARKLAGRTVLASSAVMVGSILAIDRFSGFFGFLGTTEPAYFWPPNTIPMVLLSVGIFELFRHLRVAYHPAVNALASTTLGIYILHDGILNPWMWKTVFRCAEYQDSRSMAPRILVAAGIIFAVGAGLDLLRQALQRRTLDRLLDSGRVNELVPEDCDDGRVIVKNLRESIEKSVFRSRALRLFCALFVLYVFLGMCISYRVAFDTNMFFGADNARAFGDLTDIGYNHYRVKVHPLFCLLAQSVTLLLDGVVNRPTMSVILLEALCGALGVCFFDAILGRKKVGRWFRNLFTLIYAFSFSTLIFSTVPETFIFAGLGLMAYWYFLTAAAEGKGPLSRRETFLLVFFGVVCFGVTLTNYVFYLVGLIYLLALRYDWRKGARAFVKLNVWNGAAIVVLCLYQRFVWSNCPVFWKSMLLGLTGRDTYEELQYMNWDFSLNKTGIWLKQTLLYPLMSADMTLRSPGEAYHPILFAEYPRAVGLLTALFALALALCLAVWLVKRAKGFDLREDGYMLGLLASCVGNLMLHYIYGFNEAFMYSPHYLFYFLLAGALALDRLRSRRAREIAVSGLAVFFTVEALNNLARFLQTARIALGTESLTFPTAYAIKGTIMCGVLLLAAILCWERLRPEERRSPGEGPEACYGRFAAVIKIYGLLILIPTLFVAFNY